jgi:16S rRNA (adenine1518-N6/adenine1519-N6)-dimethyltransferase
MTGREIKETLDRVGVLPSKQLGQNFLIDPNMARWIVSQLEATPEDAVVEVGPGTGSLSEHLVGKVRKLILIEFDARLAANLKERFRDDPSVEVHHADGAKFDGRQLFKHRPVKFLGNLPYSCGGAIMKNLLGRPHPFERAVVMLQKEVIDRLAAVPGTKDYGVLSLRTQVNWEVDIQRTVPPEAFYPRPKIDSAVAILRPPKSGMPAFDHRLFDELIRRGFSQRRKQLKKQLPAGIPWDEIIKDLGVTSTVRAEELNLAQWVEVTRACDPHPLKDLPQKAGEIFDVVDAQDQVVGQSTRAEVHAQRLMHRAVHVFVFNKRGHLLLQQRSMLKDVHPGDWDSSVSGHLDSGESYESAAIRELSEEMGIDVESVPEEIARIAPCEGTGWEHVRLYRTSHSGNLKYPAAEIESAMWFPLDEIAAWIAARPADFASGFLECWKAALPKITESTPQP